MPVPLSISNAIAITANSPISLYNDIVPASTFFIALPIVELANVPNAVGSVFAAMITAKKIAINPPRITPALPSNAPLLSTDRYCFARTNGPMRE